MDEQFGLPTVNDIFKELENRDAILVVNLKPQPLWTA
ncbi:transcriptional accessory protein [Actinobacillus equuli]|nr:transcriptional accessory protein [Actinobacillus equuli]